MLAVNLKQGLSQDLKTGCSNLAVVKFIWASKFVRGTTIYTLKSTINLYKFIKIRQNILKQCHGNYMEMKKFNYMLEIDILKKSLSKIFGCPEGCFSRVWVSKKTPRRPAV